ncbi:hypothetical protein DFQ28_005632 [Apophysomyces sp. BC1034]|nr:hypothetical protein DFQ30_004353 [Apophysomyces sp. BC1015]KAG0176567.1 hypothetical protein DFQ29_005967 [Apophysomyces sp. BC1021]KAG0187952.1 hypothetical protein DFQ28_005632 [Apophysomyces sp. BC1034]
MTLGSKEKKFWKKFSLGKHKQAPPPPEPTIAPGIVTKDDDDKSIKSKRLSGLFPRKRQSTASLRKHPSFNRSHSPTVFPVPALPSEGNVSHGNLPKDDGNNIKIVNNHVDVIQTAVSPNVPIDSHAPLTDDQTAEPEPSPVVHEKDENLNESADDESKVAESNVTRALRAERRPRYNSNPSKPTGIPTPSGSTSRLLTPNVKYKTASGISTDDHSPRPSLNKSTPSQRSINSSFSSKPDQAPATRLRKPSQVSAISRGDTSVTNTTASNDDLITQLKQELEKERSIVRVLQGQKEAISKDLDYFSQTVDELMEEKEALMQEYNNEKVQNKNREEDLDMLLEKLKSATDSAREKSLEAGQAKTQLENYKTEFQQEQAELRSLLRRKETEVEQLKTELAQTIDQVELLKSTMERFLRAQAEFDTHESKSTAVQTPNASPRSQGAKISNEDLYYASSPSSNDSSIHIHHHSPTQDIMKNTITYDTSHSTDDPEDNLDRQLLVLTKEKEKLQSFYSKIPLSGGGPTSRRRKEELEEMLDEVDSQLSKVKQNIRRTNYRLSER